MKRNKLILCALIALSALSSHANRGVFKLEGNIGEKSYDGLYIYLTALDPVDRENDCKIDSALIKNGHYTFTLPAPQAPYFASLALPPKDHTFVYGLPESKCIVEEGDVKLTYSPVGVELTGGVLNQKYENEVLAKEREIRNQGLALAKERETLEKSKQLLPEEMDAFNERLRALYRGLAPAELKFMSDLIATNVGAYLFFSRPQQYYDAADYARLSQAVAPELLQKAEKRAQRAEAAKAQRILAMQQTTEGNRYSNFKCKDSDGKEVQLSDFVKPGRMLLIDFWASWCGPCIQELGFIKRLYKDYHDKGLDIVSVSLDTNKGAWQKAVAKHKLPWPQISDLKGFDGEAAKAYAVSAIPFIILIDGDGNIAIRNLHDHLLENAIKARIK